MKKRLLSIIMILALAITLALGTVVVSSAQAGDCLGADASLADNITMKVYFELDKSSFKTATAKVGEKEAIDVSHMVTFDNGTASVPVEVAVKDIDKTITVTVSDGTTTYTKTDFTAKSYLASVTGDYSAIANMLIAYGDTAKAYFDAPDTLTAPDEAPAFGDSSIKVSGTIPAGLKHRSATLLIESATTIRHYFETTDGFKSIDNYTFYVDYDNDGGYDKNEALIPMQIGDRYCVDIAGITPNDIDREYTVYVTDNTTTYSCTYSAVIYAKRTYEKEDATAAQKALSATLYNYFAAANDIGANIIFKNGTETLNTVKYNYGVDNYISYFPTSTDTAAFSGWYFDEALTKPANCIEAGTTGDVTLYGKFIVSETLLANNADAQAVNNAIKAYSNVKSAVTAGNLTITTDADGNTTYNYSSFSALGNRVGVQWASGGQLNYSLTQQTTETKLVKFTVQLGKVADKAPIPFTFRINGNNDEFICVPPTAAEDGNYYVYLGDGASNYLTEEYRIAKLEDGKTVDVTFYADLSSCTSTEVNSDGVKEIIRVYATNINNELVSINGLTQAWNRNGFQIQFGDQQMTSANNATVGNPYALIIGKFDAQPAYEASEKIIDATSSEVIQNYTVGQATRLPAGASKSGYDFLGWYSDAELTNKINSIPSGTSGTVKVYPKYLAAYTTKSAYSITGNSGAVTDATTKYGDMISALDNCYTFSVAFDTTTNVTSAEGATYSMRMRPADESVSYSPFTYAKGLIKSANGKVLANVLEREVYFTFVVDFAEAQIRYYLDGELALIEAIPSNKITTLDKYNGGIDKVFIQWTYDENATYGAVYFNYTSILMGNAYGVNNVTYNTADGTVINDAEGTYSLTVTPGSTLTLPKSAVNADGIPILGWYTDAAFTKPAEDYVGEVAKSVTLYAQHPVKVNLSYETYIGKLAGTAGTDYTTSYYSGIQAVTLPTATKDDSVFVAWYLDSSFTVPATAENFAKLTDDATVYARWATGVVNAGFTAVIDNDTGNLTGGQFLRDGNAGAAMYSAESKYFTIRFDTRAENNKNWADGGSIRMSTGWRKDSNNGGTCGGGHTTVFNFGTDSEGNSVIKANNNTTVLTKINSGDVIDLVVNIEAQTITYYVNGVDIGCTVTSATIGQHYVDWCYTSSYEPTDIGETVISTDHKYTAPQILQTQGNLANSSLALDGAAVYGGNLYG